MKEIFCTACRQYKHPEAFVPEAKRPTCKSCYAVLQRRLNPNTDAGVTIKGRPARLTNASVKRGRQLASAKNINAGRLPSSWTV